MLLIGHPDRWDRSESSSMPCTGGLGHGVSRARTVCTNTTHPCSQGIESGIPIVGSSSQETCSCDDRGGIRPSPGRDIHKGYMAYRRISDVLSMLFRWDRSCTTTNDADCSNHRRDHLRMVRIIGGKRNDSGRSTGVLVIFQMAFAALSCGISL